ncbi:hypothetical protein EKK58_05725 [Candidatus Dependentiae bacterium]|nr:MAG: hypothetical protein EKK58_05725 [Candidatus Dependentiae bacterium]
MGKTTIITSPITGFSFEARKWKLHDMERLAELADEADESVDILSEAVRPTWIRTIDPGPYDIKKGADSCPDFTEMLKLDVLHSLFQVRMASWPEDLEKGMTREHYQFDAECAHCKPKYTFPQQVRLSQLKFFPLPKASLEALRSKKPLELRAPDGKLIKYELPKLAQDKDLVAYREKLYGKGKAKTKARPKPSELLAIQCTYVEGLKTQLLSDRIKYFANLDLDEMTPIRNGMSKAGSYVAQKVDCTCDRCKAKFEVRLPLQASFFMPSDPMEEQPPEPETEENPEQQDPDEET